MDSIAQTLTSWFPQLTPKALQAIQSDIAKSAALYPQAHLKLVRDIEDINGFFLEIYKDPKCTLFVASELYDLHLYIELIGKELPQKRHFDPNNF